MTFDNKAYLKAYREKNRERIAAQRVAAHEHPLFLATRQYVRKHGGDL